MKKEETASLAAQFKDRKAEDILRYFLPSYSVKEGKDRIALASSLGAEDQVLTHMVLDIKPDARIFVLDTGRLHCETYELMDRTMKRYGMRYEIFFPEAREVEEMESEHGPNLFYESTDHRNKCCSVRKVRPLKRVLSTLDAWITGLRREQAVTRGDIEKVEWDETNGLLKINPLADWSEKQVWDYIEEHAVPYNTLHDKGYPSIGCAPCTRAVKHGEDTRAGRWWWEEPVQKECGLHVVDGKLVRRKG